MLTILNLTALQPMAELMDTANSNDQGGVKLFNDTDVTESGVNSVSTLGGRYYGVQLLA